MRSSSLKNRKHRGGPTERTVAIGGDTLVGEGANMKQIAQLIMSPTKSTS
jgi:hypothetical protein